jgi:NADPH-dependent ferric siderophore reductase
MIRVTLRSEAFGVTWPIEQPGEIITLLFLPPGEEVVLPLAGWTFPADAPEQEWRNYTVRRHDPATGEIDVDVVLHEPRGPACRWAEAAPIGADVGFAGPRVDYAPHDGASWLLLCGDETALPEGVGQAWGAAESTVARSVREVLRDERGMERKLVSAKGYWLRSGEWPDDDED